ncbi:MAG: hypothetical protein IPN94_12160 [Sphingobacteriales bacterium]|nr:hypothetical protein [Sphingobacteriales bacterium]
MQITVDADNELPEDCEKQQPTIANLCIIFSDLLIPIALQLRHCASNAHYFICLDGQPLLPAYDYKIQIDTTELFNSPHYIKP